jgi:hypothetical protein
MAQRHRRDVHYRGAFMCLLGSLLPGYPDQLQQAGAEQPEGWGEGQLSEVHSGQRGSIRQGFGMIRLESRGSDCPIGMSFMGKGVNPSYTRIRQMSIQ